MGRERERERMGPAVWIVSLKKRRARREKKHRNAHTDFPVVYQWAYYNVCSACVFVTQYVSHIFNFCCCCFFLEKEWEKKKHLYRVWYVYSLIDCHQFKKNVFCTLSTYTRAHTWNSVTHWDGDTATQTQTHTHTCPEREGVSEQMRGRRRQLTDELE